MSGKTALLLCVDGTEPVGFSVPLAVLRRCGVEQNFDAKIKNHDQLFQNRIEKDICSFKIFNK